MKLESSPTAASQSRSQVVDRFKAPLSRRAIWRVLILVRPFTRLVWEAVERHYIKVHGPYLDVSAPNHLVHLLPCNYRGPDIRLRGGTRVPYGARILDFHLDSRIAAKLSEPGAKGVFRAAIEDLRCIARYLDSSHPTYLAIRGRSILRQFMLRVGADVRELPLCLKSWLQQLFEEMAVIAFREKHTYSYLNDHYAPMADAWYTIGQLVELVYGTNGGRL